MSENKVNSSRALFTVVYDVTIAVLYIIHCVYFSKTTFFVTVGFSVYYDSFG